MLNFQNKIKDNPKSFFNFVRSKKNCRDFPSTMFYGSSRANSTSEVVTLFAQFFKSNFEGHDPVVSRDFLQSVCPCVDYDFLQLDIEDVTKAITAAKNSEKLDIDGLSSAILKRCALSVSIPLQLVFNKSLKEGCFIDRWKMSYVTPTFKSGDKSNVYNYRPISKLSNVSKIFEHIIY